MSRLDGLIAELCPNGVEYYQLGDLGKFYGGLTGKSKSDFIGGNAKFITYRNVYSNPALKLDVDDTVKIEVEEKQRTLEYGDVIFTGSSETADECGISSVLNIKTDEKLYLNSFCFIFRFDNPNIMLPDFSKHLFRSSNLRYQIRKTASGVTRFNVSKKLMEKVVVPVPPLEVQREIVRVLDSFTLFTTELITELTTELAARKKQYSYYRDELLKQKDGMPVVKLKDIAVITRGGNFQKKDFVENGFPAIHYGQIYTYYGISATKTLVDISDAVAMKSKKAVKNDVVMAVTSENVDDVCKCVAWLGDEDIAISGHTAIIHHNQNAKYLSYYFHTEAFAVQKRKLAHGAKVIEVTPDKLYDVIIPLPNLEEQERIVKILDRFDSLCNDIEEGILAEIDTRQKQYEYYRDKLLSF